jgi:hypothetical protein
MGIHAITGTRWDNAIKTAETLTHRSLIGDPNQTWGLIGDA